jgi:hypothetical protein
MRRHILEGMKLAMAALAATILLAGYSHAQVLRAPSTPDSERILQNLHTEEIRSLKGLPTMAVVGEVVAVDQPDKVVLDAVSSAGLSVQEIEKVAVDALSRLKIPIVPKQKWDRNIAFLKVKVEFGAGTNAKGPYIGLVKVSLAQPIALQRQLTGNKLADTNWDLGVFDAKNFLLAETWHTQRPFNVKDIPSIVQAIRPLMQDFVIDYAAAR